MPDKSDKLHAKCNRFYDLAETIWGDEKMQSRMDRLGTLYDEGEDYENDPDLRTSVNEVFPRTRQKVASLYGQHPDFIVKPTDAAVDYGANPEAAKSLLHYGFRKKKLSYDLKDYLRDGCLMPFGVVMMGMDTENGIKLPIVRWQDPRSVRTDPTLEKFRPHEDRWEFRKIKRSIARMRLSGLYKDKDMDAVCDEFAKQVGEDFDEETCVLWLGENYVKESVENKAATIVATCVLGYAGDSETGEQMTEGSLLVPEKRMWIREEQFSSVLGMPLRFFHLVGSAKKYYPRSLVEMWLPQLDELNHFRSQLIVEAQRGNRRFWISDAVEKQQRERMEENEPLVGIVIPDGRRGDEMIGPIDLGQIPNETFQGESLTHASLQMIDGTGTAQLGSEPKRGSVSATRDTFIEQNFRLRQGEIQQIWSENLSGIAQDYLNLAQAEMKGTLRRQIIGRGQDLTVVVMDRETIAGDFEVEIGAGSMVPPDREKERAKAMEIFQMFSQRPDVNQQALVRTTMEALEMKNIDELLTVPTPPAMPGAPGAGPQGGPEQGAPVMNAVLNEMAQQQLQQPADPNAIPGMRGLAG